MFLAKASALPSTRGSSSTYSSILYLLALEFLRSRFDRAQLMADFALITSNSAVAAVV